MHFQVDELQEMAGKYADTVEENRKLYNEVQDLKGNIRVFCRIRPPGTTGDQNPSCLDAGIDGEVRTMHHCLIFASWYAVFGALPHADQAATAC